MHGITGVVGSLAIGLYASKAINPDGADGLFFGGGLSQLGKQLGGGIPAGPRTSPEPTPCLKRWRSYAGLAMPHF